MAMEVTDTMVVLAADAMESTVVSAVAMVEKVIAAAATAAQTRSLATRPEVAVATQVAQEGSAVTAVAVAPRVAVTAGRWPQSQ